MLLLTLFITTTLLTLSLIALLNAFTFPRLHLSALLAPPSTLSVLIPARDEAAVIGQTVRALLAQPEVTELLILDDQSTDGTAEVARAAANGDPRLRIITGQPLPSGWLGKNWACHQLSLAATGDHLLFTDADVQWRPSSLLSLLSSFHQTRADTLTVWPTQITETWGERLVVPLVALAVQAYLPVLATHHLPSPAFAAAMGQCLLFRRSAYERIGGHAAVKDNIVEDVALARAVKAAGLCLRVADGNSLIACRMYRNWPDVRDGFAKNILAGHGNSLVFLLLSTLFHWLVFVGPWLMMIGDWGIGLPLVALSVTVRAITAVITRQRVLDSLFMPVSVALMTLIAAQSLLWRARGGPQWKGRSVVRIS
ncbi:MAG: glycosyltransferase [Anaerolineales bacterium]